MRNADRVSSLIILGICVYFVLESKNFSKFGSFFPQVIVSILGFLALMLLVMSFIKTEKGKVFEEISIKYSNIVIAVLLVIAWVFFIKLLGFVVTSVLFFSIITIIFDRKKRPFSHFLIKIGAVGVTVGAFYLFFARLLLVPFPKGILF